MKLYPTLATVIQEPIVVTDGTGLLVNGLSTHSMENRLPVAINVILLHQKFPCKCLLAHPQRTRFVGTIQLAILVRMFMLAIESRGSGASRKFKVITRLLVLLFLVLAWALKQVIQVHLCSLIQKSPSV